MYKTDKKAAQLPAKRIHKLQQTCRDHLSLVQNLVIRPVDSTVMPPDHCHDKSTGFVKTRDEYDEMAESKFHKSSRSYYIVGPVSAARVCEKGVYRA